MHSVVAARLCHSAVELEALRAREKTTEPLVIEQRTMLYDDESLAKRMRCSCAHCFCGRSFTDDATIVPLLRSDAAVTAFVFLNCGGGCVRNFHT